MLYFFNSRDDDIVFEDYDGVDLPNFDAAKAMATISLTEFAKDSIKGASRKDLAVEILDANKRCIARAALKFEIFEI